GADDVHVSVEVGTVDRHTHVCLRRVVEAHLRAHLVEERVRVRPYVAFVQPRSVGNVLTLSRGEVVEHVHLVAASHECIDDVRADKARASGHDRSHAPYRRAAGMRFGVLTLPIAPWSEQVERWRYLDE